MDSKKQSQTQDSFFAAKEDYILLARIALIAKRYQDAIEFCQNLFDIGRELTKDEKSVLIEAYKGQAKQYRSLVQLLEEKSSLPKVAQEIARYTGLLQQTCNTIINQMSNHCLQQCSSIEGQAFYHSTIANFYRYSLQTYDTKDVARFMRQLRFTKDSYDKAIQNSLKLHQAHPTRLRTMYCYSKFQKQSLNQQQDALNRLQDALNQGLAQLYAKESNLSEDQQKESAHILQLMNEQIFVWDEELNQKQQPLKAVKIKQIQEIAPSSTLTTPRLPNCETDRSQFQF